MNAGETIYLRAGNKEMSSAPYLNHDSYALC
jgi:hypothetical protein